MRAHLARAGFPRTTLRKAMELTYPKWDKTAGPEWLRKASIVSNRLRYSGQCILMVCGETGTGKSTLATAAASVFYRQSGDHLTRIRYETWAWMAARMRSVYQAAAKETELDALNAFVAPALLVIDEYGQRRDTPVEQSLLPLVACKRYDEGKRTIIISTESPDDLRKATDVTILSRMEESGSFVHLTERLRGNTPRT